MNDLWSPKRDEARAGVRPLAVRMRPTTLGEVIGQRHILGPGKLLRRMIDADAIMSLILHGPPARARRRSRR
jgi:putative ATPase